MKTITKNTRFAIGITAILFLTTILLYNITYWLNDDVMIESLISGAYTGTPECMTYYFSVPLSFIISLFYQVLPMVPWLGVFFTFIYLFCFYQLSKRSLDIINNFEKKNILSYSIIILGLAVVYIFIFLPNIVLMHYTIIAALTGCTAIFMLMTHENVAFTKFTKKPTLTNYAFSDLPKITILMLLSYLIRENVFFMLLPFFAVAGLYRIIKDGKDETGKYVYAAIIFIVSFGIIFSINRLSYSDPYWKEYVEFNDARTTLYDYVGIHTTDEAKDYYSENNIDEDTYDLYRSYNIMLADKDFDLLNTFSDYQNVRYANRSFMTHFKEALYVYRMTFFADKTYQPIIFIILILYILSAAITIGSKQLRYLTVPVLTFFIRSGLWMYLLWNDRYPVRVTYSLLYIELFILLGFIMDCAGKLKTLSLNNVMANAVLLSLMAGAYFSLPAFTADYNNVIANNENDDVIYSYMAEHDNDFYLVDVFSTVNRTKAVYTVNKAVQNYLVIGGWMSESPLTYKKFRLLNAVSARDLLVHENVHVILKDNMYNNITIENYSNWTGLEFECTDTVSSTVDTFYVYTPVN